MALLNSNQIKVFPSVGRDPNISNDLDAELTNEKNMTQILKSIYKRENFVITDTYNKTSPQDFVFVLYGYYFKITGSSIKSIVDNVTSSATKIYANIVISPDDQQRLINSDSTGETEVFKLDIGNQFKGLVMTENNPYVYEKSNTGYQVKSFIILKKENNEWKIPSEAHLHWKTSEILNDDNTNIKDVLKSNKIENTILNTSNLNVTNSLSSTGTASLSNATISTLSSTSGTISTLTVSSLTVKGGTSTSTLTVSGESTLSDISANSTTLSTLTVSGNTTLTGDTSINSTLTVSGDTTLNSNLTVSKETILNNVLKVNKILPQNSNTIIFGGDDNNITINTSSSPSLKIKKATTSTTITHDKITTSSISASTINGVGTLTASNITANTNITTPKISISGTSSGALIVGDSNSPNDNELVQVYGKVKASNGFVGNLNGNASTASNFNNNRTISLTGAITGSSTSMTGSHTIKTSVADNTIGTNHLTNGAVTADKIATNAVTNNKILNGSVTKEKIKDSAVTGEKLASNCIDNSKITDNAGISGSKLANNSIALDKIKFNAVLSGRLEQNQSNNTLVLSVNLKNQEQ